MILLGRSLHRPKVNINWDNLGFGLQDVAQVRSWNQQRLALL
jgi:hypothetical protein